MSTEDEIRQAADVVAGMAGEFTDLAKTISEDAEGTGQILHRIVAVASRAVPGSEHAAISLMTGERPPRTGPSSDELPPQIDRIQYETAEGPCVQALTRSDLVLTNDLAVASEWPTFARRAVAETGVRSMLSFRLFLNDGNRGALNFYAMKPDAFDMSAVATGSIFAAYASMAQLAALHQDQAIHLSRAVESNREIGVAMGILMANKRQTQEQAFTDLRIASQHLHRKLRDIAAEVIYTGTLPDQPVLRSRKAAQPDQHRRLTGTAD
jgi:ANTAR domain-containing protein/GAF domain-containing protein